MEEKKFVNFKNNLKDNAKYNNQKDKSQDNKTKENLEKKDKNPDKGIVAITNTGEKVILADNKSSIIENKEEIKSDNKIVASDNKEDKKEKKDAPKIVKKEEAVARGLNLHASKKHCMYIISFIKNKEIDQAISQLEEVIKFKRVIPFKGEIPHRKQQGIMSGRYPIKVSGQIIYILKALKGNAIVNGLDLEKTRISYGSASWASRPAKKGGMRFKRVNLILKAKEFDINKENAKEIKK